MKKKYLAIVLAGVFALGMFAGCKDKTGPNPNPDDPNPNPDQGGNTPVEEVYTPSQREQSDAMVIGIEGADGVFSPFFASAAYDSEISGQTQIGMLTSEGSNYVYGDDEACVVKDLKITYLDSANNSTTSANATYTQYDFLIKNGIKFSDGEPLTIDDVLFNLYVYLDPAYTGSSTIYSTDIVGLDQYRTQSADEGAADAAETQATTYAGIRLNRIYDWLINRYITVNNGGKEDDTHKFTYNLESYENEIIDDINSFLPEYVTEITNDYDSAVSSFDETRKEYKFDKGAYWQSYLYNYGLITVQTAGNNPVKELVEFDDDGNYVAAPAGAVEDDQKYFNVYTFDFSANGYGWIKDEIDAYVAENWQNMDDDGWQTAQGATDEEKKENAKKANATKEICIILAFEKTIGTTDAAIDENLSLDKITYSLYTDFAATILGCASTNTLYNNIYADEYSKIISSTSDSATKTISGITTEKVTSFTNDQGTYELDGTYDVLHIKINKIDPKAIWNFAFTVAPQHYYAPADEAQKYVDDKHFLVNGVVFNSTDFMNDVLKATSRLRVPVGAGPYMASTSSGLAAGQKYPSPTEFWNKSMVYYERNPYFDTLDGVEGGAIQNAKIKYLRYSVVNSNFILDQLESGDLDVGNPNATQQNVNRVNGIEKLTGDPTWTNGYGYMGINAGKVPDVWMRRALIKAIDLTRIKSYYPGELSEIIYRPMSKQSWAYPQNEAAQRPFEGDVYDDTTNQYYHVDYTYDESGKSIYDMLMAHGYKGNDSQITADPSGKTLETITFTVAGESTDHPAWAAFKQAELVLEKIGIPVDVKTDINALSALTRGGLAVWAAAWSSTNDPDMYQVYHKDSRAGSTANWGYNEIKKGGAEYQFESMTIDELSELIDEAREVLDQDTRAAIYAEALDLVMELAVEMPLYQRNDLTVYNNTKIDGTTLNPNPTAFDGLFAKIWEVGYVD